MTRGARVLGIAAAIAVCAASATRASAGDASVADAGPRGAGATARDSDRVSRRIGLAEAIALVVREDAPLAAADEHVAAATAEAARSYPFNPFVQLQVLPYASAGTPVVAHYVLVMQMFELGRAQRWRRVAGRARAEQVRAGRHAALRAEALAVTRLYFAALYQCGLYALAVRRAELAGSPAAVEGEAAVLAALASGSLRHEVLLARLARDDAAEMLAARLRLPDVRVEASGDLSAWQWPRLVDIGAEDVHPDVSAIDASMALAYANWRLARATQVPGLQIGPYYQRGASGDVSVGFRAQVELPVINAGRRLEKLRVAELARQTLAAARVREDLRRRARVAADRYAQIMAAATSLRADVAAATTNAPDTSVVKAARLQADRQVLDAMFAAAQAATDVVEAMDLPLTALLGEPPSKERLP